MITPLRGALLALLGSLVLSTSAAAAERLPRPADLAPAIEFWTKIYTQVPVERGLIHDSGPGLRVYGVIEVAEPGQWQRRREQVQDSLDRHRAALNALLAQDMQAKTPLQRHLKARLPAEMPPSAIPELAKRLRFQGGLRERFREGLERSGRWQGHIDQILADHGVPPELRALPHVESSFNPIARSHAGAAGLWQFTVGTGRRFLRIDRVVDERLDPWMSSQAAAQLLAHNYRVIEHWPLAITAYNHGLNGMRRAVKSVGSSDYMRIQREYKGRYFGFASRNFYPALLAAADVDALAERYFPGLQRDLPLRPPRVVLAHYTPVATLVDGLDLDAAALQALNPALGPAVWDGRKFIPRGHVLALPSGEATEWARALAQLPGSRLYRAQRPDIEHAVAAGDTLSEIADQYAVGLQALMARNGLNDAHHIRIGQRLELPIAGAMPQPVGGQHYQVQPGDTLGAIAQRLEVNQRQLAQMNALNDPDRLVVGQRLVIDAAAQVAAVVDDAAPLQ